MTKNRTPTPVYLDPGMHPGLEVKGLKKNKPNYNRHKSTAKGQRIDYWDSKYLIIMRECEKSTKLELIRFVTIDHVYVTCMFCTVFDNLDKTYLGWLE